MVINRKAARKGRYKARSEQEAGRLQTKGERRNKGREQRAQCLDCGLFQEKTAVLFLFS